MLSLVMLARSDKRDVDLWNDDCHRTYNLKPKMDMQ